MDHHTTHELCIKNATIECTSNVTILIKMVYFKRILKVTKEF